MREAAMALAASANLASRNNIHAEPLNQENHEAH